MTSTERQTATAGKTAQSAGVTDMVDLPEGPASFNLEDFPNTEAITDIDSYLQMADDFSNYLTWDPWDFGYTY